ncbi:MAG: hypothetical protein MUO64_05905 [Anaerolineales bacterium]|nr:hypothetical protein [Anaerolineales bacterium]
MDMLCGSASSFVLENGDQVTFAPDLCGYQANLALQDNDGLPATLPDGRTLVDGMVANLVLDGNVQPDLPLDTHMTLLFVNSPAGAVVLFWDAANNAWVEVPTTITPDGKLDVQSTAPGPYVMVIK